MDNINRSEEKEDEGILSTYISKVTPLILNKMESKEKDFIYEPTLFGNNSSDYIKSLEVAHKIRQQQMKEGDIAQIAIGNFYGWEDLGIGHVSGLDCRRLDNAFIMDVKNKYNTCNSGSQKALFDKLATYKKENPQTRCIWGIINPKPGCKKLCEKFIHNGVEIEKIQGMELLKLVFNIYNVDYSTAVIQNIKKIIHKI